MAFVPPRLFNRRRPYVQTDGAVMHGLLDPAGNPTSDSLAAELVAFLQAGDQQPLPALSF
eukprot:90645-Amphidinium_carterae.1